MTNVQALAFTEEESLRYKQGYIQALVDISEIDLEESA